MIVGEYKISIKPSIPEAEKIIYSIKPTTTGGMLIKVLNNKVNIRLQKNSDVAI